MQTTVAFRSDVEHVNHAVQSDAKHQIKVCIGEDRNHVLLECTTREALFEFGRTLMEEALFGTGEIEFYPLCSDGRHLVVNGARLTTEGARVFVHFPKEEKAPNQTLEPTAPSGRGSS